MKSKNLVTTCYDLEAAAEHIVHDYASLLVAGQDTQGGLASPYNHYAERTFLVHCRSFGKFFSDESDPRDMYARHFVDVMPAISLPAWAQWRTHVDRHLMHLTIARTAKTARWTGEPNKAFLAQFKAAWEAFYAALKPSLKPAFDKHLIERRITMP